MNLKDILEKQAEFDKIHGWDTSVLPEEKRLKALERELIGLVGEVGEVANILKKARLKIGRGEPESAAFSVIAPSIKEELIDAFIYLIRLFQITGADIEAEYLRKLDINKERFKIYENGTT